MKKYINFVIIRTGILNYAHTYIHNLMIIQIPKNILSIYEISMKNYELVILITNNSSVNLYIYMTKR